MESLGKYKIVEKIGAGGFGEVFKGHDPFIKRFVAVKTCVSDDKEIRNRFFQEAEIAGNLHHRNVTTVYDFGIQDGLPYLIQEYLSGEDLHRKVKRQDFIPFPEKLFYLIQIARGLAYAHSQGVIHRDIKPSNIRILEDGTAKIMDFGIARLAQRESTLTKTGMTVGTAAYLAPEQIRGEPVSLPTDIFSFGVMAYELLTFERPFQGEQISAIMYNVLNSEPKPIRSLWPAAPQNIIALINRCLLKQPGQRFRDGGELAEALEKVQKTGRVNRASGIEEATQRMSQSPAAPESTAHGTRAIPAVTQATRISSGTAQTAETAAAADSQPVSGQRLDEMEFATLHPDSEPEIASATSALDPIYSSRSSDRGGRTFILVFSLALIAGLAGWWFGARQKAEKPLDPTVEVAAVAPGIETETPPPVTPEIEPQAETDDEPTADDPTATENSPTDAASAVAVPEVAPPPPEPEPAKVTFLKPSWTDEMRVRFQGKSLPLPTTRTVEQGTYSATFELNLPAYQKSQQVPLQLAAGQKRNIQTTIEEPGSLDVRPLPRHSQGRVFLNGQEVGETPIRNTPWDPGDYPLEVRHKSEEQDGNLSGMIKIVSGHRTVVTFSLKDGTLSSVSKPFRDPAE